MAPRGFPQRVIRVESAPFLFPLHGRLRTLPKRISAFHFAAFRRQVAAEVKGHLPLRVSFLPLLAHAIPFPVAVG